MLSTPAAEETPVSRYREEDSQLQHQIAIANARARQRDAAFAWEGAQVNAALQHGALITLSAALSEDPFYLRAVCVETHTYQCATAPGDAPSHTFALYDDHVWAAVLDQAHVARHPFFVEAARRWHL